jgi:hypothetical protein
MNISMKYPHFNDGFCVSFPVIGGDHGQGPLGETAALGHRWAGNGTGTLSATARCFQEDGCHMAGEKW